MANDATSTPSTTPSPAETLRQAAALMRERAKNATQGPWEEDDFAAAYCVYSPPADTFVTDPTAWDMGGGDSAHIASWHPLVALAVADWLDAEAETWTFNFSATQGAPLYPGDEGGIYCGDEVGAARNADHHARHSLAVARAYLGETQ